MESQTESIEEKLTSLIAQLRIEQGIFERMVYKNKNQHRRCSYFQYLLKVRRDLKLLESANLKEILNSCFQVISGKRAGQKVHLLESLKKRKLEVVKYNFLDRLLGVSRLLSKMVEPMLNAATEISVVLARTFFMGFSLTILSLLARMRVLVQQILLDVVTVFNAVSSIAQSKQTVKINQNGLEIFREIFPAKNEFVVLECVWKSDKYVLLEKTTDTPIPNLDEDLKKQYSLKASQAVRYLTVKSFLGEDENSSDYENVEDTTLITDDKSIEDRDKFQDPSSVSENLNEEVPQSSLKLKSAPRKVAFVAVKKTIPSSSDSNVMNLKECESKSGNKKDSFFSLLAAGSTKESLF